MFNAKMNEALNKQLNEEFSSAYIYLSMSAYFERIEFPGMSAWMYAQYQEELDHAHKFFNYINERGGDVTLQAIAKPCKDWESPVHAFEETVKHEKFITQCIYEVTDVAISEKDHGTNNFLQWFIAEQIEEEAGTSQILSQVKKLQNSDHGMFMLDRELGQRKNASTEA